VAEILEFILFVCVVRVEDLLVFVDDKGNGNLISKKKVPM